MSKKEEEEKFYMLQPANKSDRMCHLVAMTMRSSKVASELDLLSVMYESWCESHSLQSLH